MSIMPTIISSFASFILGSGTFERIKSVVLRQEEKDLSGEQKRQAALDEIKVIGLGIASWAVNLAIELAVAYLRKLANNSNKEQAK